MLNGLIKTTVKLILLIILIKLVILIYNIDILSFINNIDINLPNIHTINFATYMIISFIFGCIAHAFVTNAGSTGDQL